MCEKIHAVMAWETLYFPSFLFIMIIMIMVVCAASAAGIWLTLYNLI